MHRLLFAILAGAALPALAGDPPPLGDRARFGSYGSNYLLAGHRLRNSGWADTDEAAIRAHYSFRYVLLPRGASCGVGCWQHEVFVDYTGEFDFYWNGHDTRPSGPVINRISNPGLHARWRPWADGTGEERQSFVELGYEHESNGQVTEVNAARDAEVAQRAYDDRYRPYFDTISRGSNFATLGAVYRVDEDGAQGGPDAPPGAGRTSHRRYAVGAKLRLYTQQDTNVTWGPLANRGTRLSDYHRVEFLGRYRWPGWVELDARWRVGDRGLNTDSFDIGLTLDRNGSSSGSGFEVPLYVRYHRGPLNTLSNYTQRQDSVGIGLRLANF